MSVRIIIGDVRARLKELPDESVHCVVTSPPYWGLRDYGTARWEGGDPACDHRSPTMRAGRKEDRATIAGSVATNREQLLNAVHAGICGICGASRVDDQIGLEPTLGEHLRVMVDEVFAEVWRVLRKDGTCWVNYGDCYATSPNGRSAAATKAAGNDDRTFRDKPFSTIGPIYIADPRNKDRRGDHSTLRGAPPPDTPGRIAAGGALKPKDLCMIPNRFAIAMQDAGWWVRSEIVWAKPNPMPESIKDRPGSSHEKLFLFAKSERYFYDCDAVREPYSEASLGRYDTPMQGTDRNNGQIGGARQPGGEWKPQNMEIAPNPLGRNLRNVWSIPTAAFSEAHFATFPPALVETCLKAGCPIGGTVLDPFGGAGTTGLVADRLKRDAILIELNPEYAEIARKRIEGDAGMFGQVETVAA